MFGFESTFRNVFWRICGMAGLFDGIWRKTPLIREPLSLQSLVFPSRDGTPTLKVWEPRGQMRAAGMCVGPVHSLPIEELDRSSGFEAGLERSLRKLLSRLAFELDDVVRNVVIKEKIKE